MNGGTERRGWFTDDTPASRTRTEKSRFSVSLFATTLPAVPPEYVRMCIFKNKESRLTSYDNEVINKTREIRNIFVDYCLTLHQKCDQEHMNEENHGVCRIEVNSTG